MAPSLDCPIIEEAKGSKLNNNSYISIGIVVLIIASALWIKDGQTQSARAVEITAADLTHYKELQTEQQKLVNNKLDNLTELFKVATVDRYGSKDARSFAHQLQQLNPTLKVPDVP